MNYMISYAGPYYNNCGNASFESVELAQQFVAENRHFWRSWIAYTYPTGEAVATLTEITLA